jgi:hypothetical protein
LSTLLLDRPSTTTRYAAQTVTSSVGGNFYNDGAGHAVLEASGATFITNNVRRGDYIMVLGTREISQIATASYAATLPAGGETISLVNGDDTQTYLLWFKNNGAGAAPVPGAGEIVIGFVNLVTGQTANQIATNIRTALTTARTNSLFGRDFLAPGGATNLVTITRICPGNCTNIAYYAGALTGWVLSTPTAGVDLTSGNQGIWRVHEVISETMLTLDSNWNAVGVAVDGTATTFIMDNQLIYTDETAKDDTDILADVNIPTIVQQITIGNLGTATWPYKLYIWNLTSITFVFSGATHCDFDLTESIVCYGGGATAAAGSGTQVIIATGSPGTLNFRVGTFGTNYDEVNDGCHLAGIHPVMNNKGTIQFAGSSFMQRANSGWSGTDNKISGCLYQGNPPAMGLVLGGLDIETLNNFILCGKDTNGFTIFSNPQNSENILIAGTLATGFLANSGTFVSAGVQLSDSAFRPVFNMAVGTNNPTVLDPYGDYTLAELFSGSSGIGTKSYTFNPRFVYRYEGTRSPVPIQNLNVKITQIELVHYPQVTAFDAASTYRTVIDGTTVDVVGVTSVSVTAAAIVTAINASAAPVTANDLGSGFYEIIPDDYVRDIAVTVSVIGGTGTYINMEPAETVFGTYTSDVNGEINIGADGLKRAAFNNGSSEYTKYYIVVKGGATKPRRFYFVPTKKFENDMVFDIQQFDFEGRG